MTMLSALSLRFSPQRLFLGPRRFYSIDYSTVDPTWIRNFSRDSVPRERLTLKFMRSSGPGGQNVNKVSTKVDMRFTLDDALWLPDYIRIKIKQDVNGIFLIYNPSVAN